MDDSRLTLIKKRKEELGWTNKILSEKSGIPEGTVNKILCGATKYPRNETIEALMKALELSHYSMDSVTESCVREAMPYYSADINTYYSLSGDRRAELIDGRIYDMASPSLNHQTIILEVVDILRQYMKAKELDCRVFMAPCDVCLDEDAYTMVQPDIFVVCDPSKYEKGIRVNGAPELVMEIVSKTSQMRDYYLKLQKYQNAGVKEYWIIDPAKRRIVVYHFWEDTIPVIYGFDSIVESKFYPHLRVDFAEIEKLFI